MMRRQIPNYRTLTRYQRQRRYAYFGWIAFAVSTSCALLAIWQWDGRLLATSGVALFAALVLALASDGSR